MSNDPKDERAHRARIEAKTIKVRQLYEYALKEFAMLIKDVNFDHTKPFSFDNFPKTKKRLQKILQGYASSLKTIIDRSTKSEWYAAFQKADTKSPLKSIYTARSREALQQFQNRVENGLNLSDRIWKYTGQFRQEIELALSTGIEKGTSAKEMASRMQQYLNEPDKLFRRVRDKHGALHLSKNAKAYHPGQGVYRSSYKNALRLTRNEINDAYRSADHFRWQNDKSVIGFEVKLSNRHKVRDMCDDLKGKYPKEFKFRGWHVNCLCFVVPITMSDDDFEKVLDAEMEIEPLPKGFKPDGLVTDVPKGFKEWIKDNEKRSARWKAQPNFIKDNFKDGKISGGLRFGTMVTEEGKIEKYLLSEDKIKALKEKRNFKFYGKSEHYNHIVSGFDIEKLDDEIVNLFEGKGYRFNHKEVIVHSNQVKIYYEADPIVKGDRQGLVMVRRFYIANNERIVEHSYLTLPESLQGSGVTKDLFRQLYKQYQNAEISRIEVHANIDVGGYSWARYGFYPNNNEFLLDLAKKNLFYQKKDFKEFMEMYEAMKDNKELIHRLASMPFGKKLLLNSDWYGSIDLTNAKHRELFESYLFNR